MKNHIVSVPVFINVCWFANKKHTFVSCSFDSLLAAGLGGAVLAVFKNLVPVPMPPECTSTVDVTSNSNQGKLFF